MRWKFNVDSGHPVGIGAGEMEASMEALKLFFCRVDPPPAPTSSERHAQRFLAPILVAPSLTRRVLFFFKIFFSALPSGPSGPDTKGVNALFRMVPLKFELAWAPVVFPGLSGPENHRHSGLHVVERAALDSPYRTE